MLSRIDPVKAARPVWAGGHAETAANATVKVHEYNSILALECGLGGTYLDTRRVFTMVAQDHKRLFM